MTRNNRSRWCDYCEERVLAIPQQPLYWLHALLAFFTCGLSLLVSVPVIVFAGAYRCRRCGGWV